jgi:hypothetical protein
VGEGVEGVLHLAALGQQLLTPSLLVGAGFLGGEGLLDEPVEAVEAVEEFDLLGLLGGRAAEAGGQVVPGAAGQALLEALPGGLGLAVAGQDGGEGRQGRAFARFFVARASPEAASRSRDRLKRSAATSQRASASAYRPCSARWVARLW